MAKAAKPARTPLPVAPRPLVQDPHLQNRPRHRAPLPFCRPTPRYPPIIDWQHLDTRLRYLMDLVRVAESGMASRRAARTY